MRDCLTILVLKDSFKIAREPPDPFPDTAAQKKPPAKALRKPERGYPCSFVHNERAKMLVLSLYHIVRCLKLTLLIPQSRQRMPFNQVASLDINIRAADCFRAELP